MVGLEYDFKILPWVIIWFLHSLITQIDSCCIIISSREASSGTCASGLVGYIPFEAWLDRPWPGIWSGLVSSSWLLECPGGRLWRSLTSWGRGLSTRDVWPRRVSPAWELALPAHLTTIYLELRGHTLCFHHSRLQPPACHPHPDLCPPSLSGSPSLIHPLCPQKPLSLGEKMPSHCFPRAASVSPYVSTQLADP